MSDIDWSKAPEGATHWAPDNDHYCEAFYKWVDGEWMFAAMHTEWKWRDVSEMKDRRLADLVDRYQAPKWSGEGLPPAGTVCEMTHSGWGRRGWERVTINYCSAEYAITNNGEGEQHWHMRNIRFRPIKTQAQIEAEAVNQAIKEIAAIICRDGAFDIDDPEVTESAAALYGAGYRLQSNRDPHDSDD